MKKLFLCIILFSISYIVNSTEQRYKGISVKIPDSWDMKGTIIYNETDKKVGEVKSKKSWPYKTGDDFIKKYKKRFFDDPEDTRFIKSGSNGNVFWVCRSGGYSDGKGGYGIWYTRTFWVNGPILQLHSHKSCDDEFDKALNIAKTLKES